MIATTALLGLGAVLSVAAPHMSGAAWARRAPRLAVLAWQTVSATAIVAMVLAGLTMLIPSTSLGSGLAEMFHSCLSTLREAYGTPGQLPGVLLGLILAVALPLRVASSVAVAAIRGWRRRRSLRRFVASVAHRDADLGASIVEADASAAAFCVPGKGGTIVLTTAALRSLTAEELAGVLAHERAHLRGHHDLPVAAAHALARALPFSRLLGFAAAEITGLVELLADDAAAREVDRVSIASALVTLAGMRAPVATLPAAEGATAVRVARLLQPAPPLHRLQSALGVLAGILALAGPLVIAGIPLVASIASGLCTVPQIAVG